VELRVGSKEFAEQLILGQIAVAALGAAGAKVTDRTGLTGTEGAREALTSGEIDLYWEYTGTGVDHHPRQRRAGDGGLGAVRGREGGRRRQRHRVDRTVCRRRHLRDRRQSRGRRGVRGGVDLRIRRRGTADPGAATLCSAEEFLGRDDGLSGLEQPYDFDLPDDGVVALDLATVYTEVGAGDRCDFAVVFATDGQIVANDLRALDDDQSFFPAYNVSMTMRAEVYDDPPRPTTRCGARSSRCSRTTP